MNNNEYKRYGFLRRIFKWKDTYKDIIESNGAVRDLEKELELTQVSLKEIRDERDSLKNDKETLLENLGELKALKENSKVIRESADDNKQLLEQYKEMSVKLSTEKDTLEKEIVEMKKKNEMLTISEQKLSASNTSKDSEIGSLKESINNLQSRISEDQQKVMEDTNKLLGIFQKTTGAAGKIAELRLEDLITKTSIESDSWTTNLTVGQDTVEFAIKAEDTNNKWIPVDSKLIGAFDAGDEIVVNDSYIKKVSSQAKKVSKYLNKINTTPFGIMVLQSDFVYNEIYEQNPEILTNSIVENSVFIMSPSAFVQFSTAINKLTKTFEKAKRASEISGELNTVIKHINNMTNAWDKGFDFLRKIDDTHMRNIKSSVERVETLNKIEYKKEQDNIIESDD